MNIALFRYYAETNGDKMRDIAKSLNKSIATVSNNLNGRKGEFSRADISKLKKRWQLTPEQVDEIFFND